jgi:D-alanine-D-alanine ligase
MEELRIHFTGSGSSALIDCLDKAFTKSRLRRARIITPAYEIYHPNDIINTKLKFPLIAKPIHEDGSVGISDDSISKNVAELAGTVKKIHEIYEQAALVEEYIEGRDITASVIGNGEEVTVLPLSESVFYKHDGPTLLTFEANWVPESKAYQNSVSKCPCELDYEVELRIKDFAKKAYKIMRCRDYARIDFRLRDKTPYVLEVNPNPCINPIGSGFVTSGEASGLSYDELINKILENSVKSRNLVAEPFSFGDMYGNYSQRSHKKRQTHYRNDIIQNKDIPYRR